MSSNSYSGKVILVGPSGVGKTSLLNTYITGTFDKNSTPTVSPTAIQVSITLDNQISVELALWDTAGQEKFQSISQMFYRGSNLAIICVLSSQISEIEKWVQNIREIIPECIILLAFTKVDLLSTEEQVNSMQKVHPILTQFNIQEAFLTSSTTGEGITMLFAAAAQAIYSVKQKSFELTTQSVDIQTTEKKDNKCC